MDKKKKIIIGSVVAVALLAVVIGFGFSSNKNDESGSDNSTTLNDGSSNENESEVKPALGSNFVEFEKGIKDLKFEYFDEGCYELSEDDRSLCFIQLLDENIIITIKDKNDISKEAIISAIKLLVPNQSDQVVSHIEESTDSISMSVDNRTVNIEFNDNEVNLTISK